MLKNTLKCVAESLGIAEQLKLVRDRNDYSISDFDRVYQSLSQDCSSLKARKNKVAILPAAASPGGLGDEALVKGLLAMLQAQDTDVTTIGVLEGDAWDFLPKPEVTLPSSTSGWLDFRSFLTSVDWVFIIGADIMDGGYGLATTAVRIKLAHAANALGVGATITGFSFNGTCPPALIELYRKLGPKTTICLRDPFSKDRFESATGKETVLAADLAFSMKPNFDVLESREYYKWLLVSKSQGRKVLGLNICPHTADSDYGNQNSNKLLDQLNLYSDAVSTFLGENPDYDALLIPHDYRGMLSDLNMSLILANRLSLKVGKQRVRVVDGWGCADEIKAVASQMNFVLTGRMHLAIASLSTGTPAACFTYQGKFEGLFELLALPKKLLNSVKQSSVASVCNTLKDLSINEDVYREQVDSKKDILKDLSLANIKPFIDQVINAPD